MEKETRRDLIISGVGTAAGGVYNKVKIEGTSKVNGDIDCIDFILNGTTNMKGNVKAKLVNIQGSAVISENVQSDQIKIYGKSSIKGSVAAEEVNIQGEAAIDGNCEAESFRCEGVLTVGGLLNAGNIEIKVYGNCRAKEIGGEIVRVKKGHGNIGNIFKIMFAPFGSKLSAETVEGDEIYLESTKARVVRGNNVTIGPGCEIELVEYKNGFQQDKEAKVRNHQQIK